MKTQTKINLIALVLSIAGAALMHLYPPHSFLGHVAEGTMAIGFGSVILHLFEIGLHRLCGGRPPE